MQNIKFRQEDDIYSVQMPLCFLEKLRVIQFRFYLASTQIGLAQIPT